MDFGRSGDCNYQVIVLYEGYSKTESDIMKANCTCTLIKGPINLIVDTMTAWDGDRIIEALTKHNLKCSNIDYVICTHGHSDHIGCNYLFPDAKYHIVGHSISNRDSYLLHDFSSGEKYVINGAIEVVPTPGHTLQDVSVIVRTDDGVVGITGDLFEREEDMEDDTIWKEAGSDSHELQNRNRKRMLETCRWIVPGHGPMFKVPPVENKPA